VFASGGPFIYEASGGTLTLIFTAPSSDSGTNFESLAVGPDYAEVDSFGNALHPFLIYACDTKGNTIVRLDPANTSNVETVYNNSVAGLVPVCGRFSSTGDLYVANKSASDTGGNVYKFSAIANTPLGGLTTGQKTPGAVTLGLPATFTGAGITQKNVGDLLVVDTADNEVLRAPYGPPFGTATSYISEPSTALPVGIARISTGDVFVANQGSSNVAHFDRTGATASTCATLAFPTGAGASTNTRIFFLGASETDTIYAAASTSTSDFTEDLDFVAETSEGQVWSWSPGQACTLTSVAVSRTLLFGVAVAPIPTAPITHTLTATVANPTPTSFNFNTDALPSNVFQITAGGGCAATVTAYPLSLANITSMINLAKLSGTLPDGARPLVNLGEGGYEIAYVATATTEPACTSAFSDGISYADAIFGLYDSALATNPRLIQCESDPPNAPFEPAIGAGTSCVALTTVGSYPVGGIPTDPGTVATGHVKPNSVFFLVNANVHTVLVNGQPQPQAIFCGFFPPLKNTMDPTQAANFDDDDVIAVVFRLAKAGGDCNRGPFDNSAKALLSIAQFMPSFKFFFPLQTTPPGGSFQSNGSGSYITLLPVHANHLAPGEYSLSVLFQTDDTSQQSIVFNVGTP
jgi:hypothetical protein